MSRLPIPGSDKGSWGEVLNDYLTQAHATDGTLKANIVTTTSIADAGVTEPKLAAGVQSKLNTALQPADITGKLNTSTAASTYIPITAKGAVSGVASLDSGSQLPESQVPTRLTASSLAVAYAPAYRSVYGSRWIFDGDSITINGISSDATNQDRSRSWTSEMARQSNGRIQYVFNAGLSGQTTAGALARFDTYVAPKSPQVVLLTAGTNDIGAARSQAAWLADIEAYFNKCRAIGATLVLGAIWPSDTNTPTGRSATARTMNDALRTWASTYDVQVIPWDTLADPSTGGWPAGWSADGLHPTLLNGYATIGLLGWQSVEPKAGPVSVRRAVSNGADALPNGFFTTLVATITAPVLSNGVASTASGTLPAGSYSYRYTARTYWGEGLPSVERVVVLASTGTITITNGTVSGARGYRVYRKSPGDTTWKYLNYIASSITTTYVDDGSVATSTDMTGVDTSRVPTGITAGGGSLHTITQTSFTEAGVRGNIFRLAVYESGVAIPADFYSVTVIAGEQYDVSALIRCNGTTEGVLIVRYRDVLNAALGQTYIARDRMTNGFGRAAHRITIPPLATSVRVSFEHSDNTGTYVDFAEVQLQKVV